MLFDISDKEKSCKEGLETYLPAQLSEEKLWYQSTLTPTTITAGSLNVLAQAPILGSCSPLSTKETKPVYFSASTVVQGTTEWLDLRNQCAITWSEAANVLGLGYTSRYRYMEQKLGYEPPNELNEFMRNGQLYERYVVDLYREHLRANDVRIVTDGFRQDSCDPRLGGSVDRLVHIRDTDEVAVLECKTKWKGDLRDEIPSAHLVQMNGLCHSYVDYDHAHYASLLCSDQTACMLQLSEVRFDPTLWNTLYERAYKPFADLWSARKLPPARMTSAEKLFFETLVRTGCTVRALKLKWH